MTTLPALPTRDTTSTAPTRCQACGRTLAPTRSSTRFCGPACRQKAYRQRHALAVVAPEPVDPTSASEPPSTTEA